jgi:tetratricopeptide (TPR) repeat protein
MRRIVVLVVAAMAMISAADAQILFRFDKKSILDAIARSDKDLENPKRAARGQTWLDRGDAMFTAEGVMLTQTYPGQSKEEMVTRLGKAESSTQEVNGKTYEVMSYPYADVYLLQDVVQFWVMKETVMEGAAEKAIEAYRKAVELDPKLKEKASNGMSSVGDIFSVNANREYNMGNDEAAADAYYKAFKVKSDPLIGKIDSISIFNAGYITLMKNDYEKAIPLLEEAIANNVWEQGKTPYFLSWALLQTQQYDKVKPLLEKALELFPGNSELIGNMISYYGITEGDFGEIREMLEKALVNDPTNEAVWNGLAQVYLKETDKTKSEPFFRKYVEAFPNLMEANYYMGDLLMEQGNDIVNTEPEKANEFYRQAWKYIEKAYSVKPTEKAVVQRLQHLSHRLYDDPGMEANLERYTKEFEALDKGGSAE